MLARRFQSFLQQDYAIGILLFIAAALAMLCANTPFVQYYDLLFSTPVRFTVGPLDIHKPLLLWINDGLMAIFFLLIGLEVKQEVLDGELSSPAQVMLPGIGAIGGMVVPALTPPSTTPTPLPSKAGPFLRPPILLLPWAFWHCWASGCRPR